SSCCKNSNWGLQRILIFVNHGVSLDEEHGGRRFLYISPQQLDRRLEILRQGDYNVLPLAEALERLSRRDLPPRSVVLTFDDGPYDFYKQAYPRLRHHRFPATVYLTTYYSDLQRPVFGLMCSYLLWKARNHGTAEIKEFGVAAPVTLASSEEREQTAGQVVQWADRQNLTGEQKDQIATRLAE